MSTEWKSDEELFPLALHLLYSPVIGDILDELGFLHQILPHFIQPMLPEMKIIGRAMPVVMGDVAGREDRPFGKLTEALDQLEPGEIYIASGGEMPCAYWGELLTATAKRRGARGAVINGFHRDTPRILEQEWPVFSRGRFAQDSLLRTKVIEYRCAIEFGSVRISPGDLIFGDLDGLVVVPAGIEEKVITLSLEKARGEKIVRKAIENGMSSTEAFRQCGIL